MAAEGNGVAPTANSAMLVVVVARDSATARGIQDHFVQGAGIAVVSTRCGPAGANLIRRMRPDVLLVDTGCHPDDIASLEAIMQETSGLILPVVIPVSIARDDPLSQTARLES